MTISSRSSAAVGGSLRMPRSSRMSSGMVVRWASVALRVPASCASARQVTHEAAHAGVLAGEAVVIDEIAPDRHGLATAGAGEFNRLPVRLARTGGRRALRA